MKPEDDTHVGGRGQGTALDIVVVRYGLIVEDMNAKSSDQKKKKKQTLKPSFRRGRRGPFLLPRNKGVPQRAKQRKRGY